MGGFTFVGREAEVATFRQLLERPQGELLLVAGAEGSGKSHLLRQWRQEAEHPGCHTVQQCCVGHVLDADLRQYEIISALAAAHEPPAPSLGQTGSDTAQMVRLVPNPREFFGYLLGEDRRPVAEKLLGLLAVASGHLGTESRLVLLLDLGRAQGRNVFPIESLTRHLPERVKLVVAANEVPEGVEGMERVTVIAELPPFGEAEVRSLLEFHHPSGSPVEPLVGPTLAKFHGHPLLTDVAAKLTAGAADPASALADLPTAAGGLCQQLLARLNEEQRTLVECVARVPSGMEAASLRSLLDVTDADVERVLLYDEVRDVVLTAGSARGVRACIFHETFTDLFLGGKSPEIAAFHKRVAAHFLDLVQKTPHNIEALGAHSYHIRLSGDRTQFMQDFPRTLRLKQNLGLLHLLAGEYRLLLMWSRGGETTINRPLCMANLARIHQQLGEYQEALRHHRDALEIYQRQSDRNGTAAQLAAIASVLCDLGHHEEAVKSLHQATALNEAAGNKAALASDLANLGVVQERVGRLHEALRSHQRALELYRGLKNELDAASQLAHMAAIRRTLGDPREAVSRYQEAWRLNNRSGATRAEIGDLVNLGLVFEELDDMEKAVTCIQQAVELDHSLGDRQAEGKHLRTLGAMHLQLHEAEEAARSFQQAVTLARSFGDPSGETSGLIALAQAQRAAGQTTEARRSLEQAATLAARLSDAEVQAQVHAALEELERAPAAEAEATPAEEDVAPPEPAAESPPEEIRLDEAAASAPADDDAEPSFAGAEDELPGDGDLVAALRAELEEARRRIADLEGELQRHKQVVSTLREIVAKVMQNR